MKRKNIIQTHNVLPFVLAHFVLALLLLLLTQLLFAWVNHGLFSIGSAREVLTILLGNLHFGIAGASMFCAPFLIFFSLPLQARWQRGYQTAGRWLYSIPVGAMLAANIIDIPYYQWTLRRMAGDIFGYLGSNFEGGFGDLMGEFLTGFWYYFLLFFFLIALMIWISKRIVLLPRPTNAPSRELLAKASTRNATSTPPNSTTGAQPARHAWIKTCGVGLLIVLLTLTGIRGGWILQHKPLAPIDASRYALASNAGLVINTPFSIVRTLGNTTAMKRLSYFESETELNAIFTPVSVAAPARQEEPTNVVLIILESFSEEFIGCLNGGGESYTPFLDSLAQHCQVYQGRANGKRSIESLPALLLGIPSLMDEAYITSSFSLNRTQSLPQILKRHGYESAFFHGAYNGSMNFDGFAHNIGIDHYYGMDEYGNRKDFDGTWGIFDEPFLQYSVRQMSQMHQPFFSTVYTISSHHPYTIPKQHVGRFKKGSIPLLETIGYADYALRRFFEAASQTKWYAHTLFVITADHSIQPQSDRYKASSGVYNVPVLLFRPGMPESSTGHVARLFQHIDLMPTLVDYLGLGEPCLSFGKSVLRDNEPYHIAYPGDYYQLTRKGQLITFNGARFEVFDLATDPLAQHDVAQKAVNDPVATENKQFLKALIQQYTNRMIDNRLTP